MDELAALKDACRAWLDADECASPCGPGGDRCGGNLSGDFWRCHNHAKQRADAKAAIKSILATSMEAKK